jgi:hypothetical protein
LIRGKTDAIVASAKRVVANDNGIDRRIVPNVDCTHRGERARAEEISYDPDRTSPDNDRSKAIVRKPVALNDSASPTTNPIAQMSEALIDEEVAVKGCLRIQDVERLTAGVPKLEALNGSGQRRLNAGRESKST